MKKCYSCKNELLLKFFYKDISKQHGVSGACKNCSSIMGKAFRLKNREKMIKRQKIYRLKNRKKLLEKQKIYYWKNREKYLAYAAIHGPIISKKLRMKVIEHYGNKCICCGEFRYEFLAIDHINGNGNKHRLEIGKTKMIRWIIKNNFPNIFQILCHNCNQAKGSWGRCPHELER